MALFDVDELLEKLKSRGMVPASAGRWTSARIIEAISDEFEEHAMPLLIRAAGEFMVKTEDVALVADQASYRPNSRLAAYRELSIKRADGTVYPLEEITPPQRTEWMIQPLRQGQPTFYIFEDGKVTLWPVPSTGTQDSLRVKYHYQMSRLAVAADTVAITTITADTPTAGKTRYGCAALPAAMNAGAAVDIVRGRPSFDLLAFDLVPQTALATSATSVDVLTSAIPAAPDAPVVGDRISLARYTSFPLGPKELHLPTALRAASAILKSKGDRALSADLLGDAMAKEASLLSGILKPRSRGNIHRIVSRRFR